MKKGQSQLIAYVLLIGFTVTIGILVGGWMLKEAKRVGTSTSEMAEKDTRCADVSIVQICEGNQLKLKNKGYFVITKLKVNNMDVPFNLAPNQAKAITLNIPSTVIPFIKIEEKEYGCSNKALTINELCTV